VSIYLTTSYQDIPARDGYGNVHADEITIRTDYTIVPGIVALGITEGSLFTRVHMTTDEARELVAGLLRAINRETEPS
jgi:hypothetical protein